MPQPSVVVSDLHKLYFIGDTRTRPETLYDAAKLSIVSPFRRLWGLTQGRAHAAADLDRELWALREISFEVEPGQIVGLIGRNGAGKSTLLKILSRVTQPTRGRVELHGSVGALLEVGTGFHGQLTGRENVYLNGAILGMSKSEIDRKFDEIVAFAEVEDFIDTPIRFYSSGMTVRLAFAVAAHLEPEILIMDEVLSVGDVGFQKKSLDRVHDVARKGRTVLFVSHQMGQVAGLCDRVILLDKGKILADGRPDEVIPRYYALNETARQRNLRDRTDREGNGKARIIDAWIENAAGMRCETLISGEPATIKALVERAPQAAGLTGICWGMHVVNEIGIPVTNLGTHASGKTFSLEKAQTMLVECHIGKLTLHKGRFTIGMSIHAGCAGFDVYDAVESVLSFDAVPGDFYGTGIIPGNYLMMIDNSWSFTPRD